MKIYFKYVKACFVFDIIIFSPDKEKNEPASIMQNTIDHPSKKLLSTRLHSIFDLDIKIGDSQG